MTFSPRMTTSRPSGRAAVRALLVEIFSSRGWRILPDEPKRCQWRRGELVEMTGVASERP